FVPHPVTPPPNGSGTSVLTINVAASVAAGNYSFTAQGTSGALTRTATLNLSVTGKVTVLTPNGRETWPIGTNQQITWTASVSGKLTIYVSRDGGATWQSLFSNVANNGRKTWKVTGPATTQARIRVCDLSGPNCDTSDANFTIQ